MRSIILSLFIAFIVVPCISQQTTNKEVKKNLPNQVPVKNEMSAQMKEVINELNKQVIDLEKQLGDAKKNKEDESVIKDLESQIAMMKKQVEMIGGVSKSMSGISDKPFKTAAEEEGSIVPKKDITRISMLPKKILTEAELLLFITKIHTQVEKAIPVAEKTEALKMYNEVKTEHGSVVVIGNAATGYWMLGHWEKALFIIGKVCLEDISNADNLNNYAAFLISTGAEHAALPILEYLNNKYPENSTIKNNIGQAWFGLGDLENAKKNLDETIQLYPGHSMANATLSNVYQAEGDDAKAISFLKASLKEAYDPEKEQQLLNLGYKTTYSDMPPFDYPMKKDPFDLIEFLNTWDPDAIQKNLADVQGGLRLMGYIKGVKKFDETLTEENQELDKDITEIDQKLSTNQTYMQEYLEPFNCPAYLQAARSLQLLTYDIAPGTIPLIPYLLLPFAKRSNATGEIPLSIGMILKDCQKIWEDSVIIPFAEISQEYFQTGDVGNCAYRNQKKEAFLRKKAEIYRRGVELIKNEFVRKSSRLDAWIRLNLYSQDDEPPKNDDSLTKKLITNHLNKTIKRKRFRNKVHSYMSSIIARAQALSNLLKNACPEGQDTDQEPETVVIDGYNKKILDCEFEKTFITPIRYEWRLMCNTVIIKKEENLKERKPDINKGSVQNSTGQNSNPAPIQTPSGPNDFFSEEIEQNIISSAPLNAENRDISQCYFEYNKWGNFVGFKFQLNEDKTELKDPNSTVSDIDSRWSWNAIASPKKGFFNKLVIK